MSIKHNESFSVRLFLDLILLTQCYVVFFHFFNDTTRLAILVGLWVVFFSLSLNRFGLKTTLIRAIIYSIPTSFVNIMGTDYGSFPLSYFNLFSFSTLFLIILEWITNKRIIVKKMHLVALLGSFIISSIIPTAYSLDLINAGKQFLNILLFCILITISLVMVLPSKISRILIGDYLRAATITCIGLITQILLFKFFGIIYGKLDILGSMRTAYGFLFSDYSFLSLYLSSAAILTFTLMLYNRKVSISLILYSVLLAYGSILTTARTGIVALLCALVFYGIIIFIKRPLVTVSIMAIVIFVSGFYIEYSTYQRHDMIGSSGRLAGYSAGIEELIHKPVFGTGFGVQSYAEHYGTAIPHNIVIQYFVQGGLLVGLLVTFILISFLVIVFKYAHAFFLPISTMIIGAQFIPDIFNSRFFPVIIMISLLSVGYSMRQEVHVIENNPASVIK